MTSVRQKLLFVDDDEFVLRGLARVLEDYESQWEMHYATGALEALRKLEQTGFDAIITDVRMPGMNGAELLTEVMRRRPETIRVALSGFADRELILQCAKVAHQYLAKPCDAEVLERVLTRVAQLNQNGQGEVLRQLLARCPVIPSVPRIYSDLVAAINGPACPVEKLGDIVANDAAMTTQVLKLVNSAFFGMGRRVSSPREAVFYLGVETIKSLMLGCHLFQPLGSELPQGFSLSELWEHCQLCAEGARFVAKQLGGSQQECSDAYLAGLMHRIGQLLLATNLPEEYSKVVQRAESANTPLAAAEREILGADHAELGGYFAGLLGIAVPVVDAITYYQNPQQAPNLESLTLIAVHVGNWFATARRPGEGLGVAGQADGDYLRKLELQDRTEAWRRAWLSTAH